MSKPVTDPSILAQLNGDSATPVTDPAILAQLNGTVEKPQSFLDKLNAGSQYNPMRMGLKAFGKATDNLMEGITKGANYAGEKTTDVATTLGAPPEVAAGLGVAANVGIQAIPMIYGGGTAKVAAPRIRQAAEELMRSSLKPTLQANKVGDAKVAIDTLLEKGLNVTPGGVEKLRAEIEVLNNSIKNAIATSPERVSLVPVAKPLIEKLKQFKMQVNPQSDLNAIRSAWAEFSSHPLLRGQKDIPVQLAQDLKQGTYQQLYGKYGEMSNASNEAQKAIARGLKEGIAAKVPQIAGLNAEESKLLKTLNVTERRVLISMNKNPIGLGMLVKNPAALAAFMADRSELFKSLIARMLNAGKVQIPVTAARTGIGGVEAINQMQQNSQ